MVREKHRNRPADPAAMGAGDSELDVSPPNVASVQPPAEGITQGSAGSAAGSPDAAARASGSDGVASGGGAAPRGGAAPNGGVVAGETQIPLDEETEALRRDLKDMSDRHLRLAAEFDNYRKRVDRERQESWARAQADLAGRLLDVLDDLERVAHHMDAASAGALLEGVQLVEKKLRTVLGAAGLEQIDAESSSFDPNSMEAVAMLPAEHPDEDDTVSDVFQRGYRFKGQLLRPARVRVKKHQ